MIDCIKHAARSVRPAATFSRFASPTDLGIGNIHRLTGCSDILIVWLAAEANLRLPEKDPVLRCLAFEWQVDRMGPRPISVFSMAISGSYVMHFSEFGGALAKLGTTSKSFFISRNVRRVIRSGYVANRTDLPKSEGAYSLHAHRYSAVGANS